MFGTRYGSVLIVQPVCLSVWLSQIHRAPYDFRIRRLTVEFRDRAEPFRISFLRRPWSHIQRNPDDIYNLKSQGALQQAARVPPGRRPGAAGMHTGLNTFFGGGAHSLYL